MRISLFPIVCVALAAQTPEDLNLDLFVSGLQRMNSQDKGLKADLDVQGQVFKTAMGLDPLATSALLRVAASKWLVARNKAVGFTYNYNEARGEYVHPAAITLLSPEGKVARYLYGLEYPEKTLRLGLVEASEGRVGTSLDKLVLYCFHYDSSEGRYAPIAARVMQLGGGVCLALFAGLLTILIRRDKKRTLVESTAQ